MSRAVLCLFVGRFWLAIRFDYAHRIDGTTHAKVANIPLFAKIVTPSVFEPPTLCRRGATISNLGDRSCNGSCIASTNKNSELSPAVLFRWMPGTSPGMTRERERERPSLAEWSRFCGAARSLCSGRAGGGPGCATSRPGHGISCRGSSAASATGSDASTSAAPSLQSAGYARASR